MSSLPQGSTDTGSDTSAGEGDFNGYTFARTDEGHLVELPQGAEGGRVFLVFHHGLRRLARLHIVEGLAGRGEEHERLVAFRKAMGALERVRGDGLGELISWGTDGEEGYYGQRYMDGERLPDYLERVGALSLPVALAMVADVVGALCGEAGESPALKHLSESRIRVIRQRDRPGLCLDDYSAWHLSPELPRRQTLESLGWLLATFLTGRRLNHIGEMSFACGDEVLSQGVHEWCRRAIGSRRAAFDPFDDFRELREALLPLRDAALESWEGDSREDYQPRSSLLERLLQAGGEACLTEALRDGGVGKTEWMPASFAIDDLTDAKGDWTKHRLVLAPGHGWVPKESWLPQHRHGLFASPRRAGGRVRVKMLADQQALLVYGEEKLEGASLAQLIHAGGTLMPEEAVVLGRRVLLALSSVEKHGVSVWSLDPDELILGTGIDAFHRAVDRGGLLRDVSLHYRLHPTVETWLRGVVLPDSFASSLQSSPAVLREARQAAVTLSLVWFALSGRRLDWRVESGLEDLGDLPMGLANWLEERRQSLRDEPEQARSSFFRDLETAASAPPERVTSLPAEASLLEPKPVNAMRASRDGGQLDLGIRDSADPSEDKGGTEEANESEGVNDAEEEEVEEAFDDGFFEEKPRDLGLFRHWAEQEGVEDEEEEDDHVGEAGHLFPARSLSIGESSDEPLEDEEEEEDGIDEIDGEPVDVSATDKEAFSEIGALGSEALPASSSQGSMAALLREAEERARQEGQREEVQGGLFTPLRILVALVLGVSLGGAIWWAWLKWFSDKL